MTPRVHSKTKSSKLPDRFAAWLRGNDRADHTVSTYLQTLRQFTAWFEASNGYPLTTENLTPSDIKQYRERLIKQGYKPASTNRALAALRAFGKWIADTQHVTDPAAKIKLVSLNRFKAGQGPKGLDKQEVPLNAPVRDALSTWLKYRAGLVGADVTALFVTKYREGVYSDAVQHLLQELSQDAGVHLTPHTLRHTFGKSLTDAGVNLEQVAALMGHTSLETTRIYTTPTEQDLVKAVEKLGS